jgi:hypothetical protein
MDESKIDDIPQVSMQGNESLVGPFIEEEVKKSFTNGTYQSPGSDGFPIVLANLLENNKRRVDALF